MFEFATKRIIGESELMLPVQPANSWPAPGFAVSVYVRPAVIVEPIGGLIVPLPSSVSVSWRLAIEITFNANVVLIDATPSLTVIVILAVPDFPAAGVSVTVLLLSLPPKTIFAFG